MDAQPAIPRRQFGMVTPPVPPASENTRMRLTSSMKAEVSARLAEPARFRPPAGRPCRDDAARAARHLGDQFGAEALDDLIQCPRYRRQRGKLLDEAVTACDGFPALDRLAVAIDRREQRLPPSR